MHSIINRSSMGLSRRWPSSNARPTSQTVLAALAVTFLFFISDALPAPKVGGVGGKPPSGEAQILPVSLGAPTGCSGSEGRALNTAPAAADTTVGVMTFCSGSSNLPYYWRNGQWHAVGLLPGGFASGSVYGVSDLATEGGQAGPTLSGDQIGGGEGHGFVWMPGRGLMALPLINGFRWTNAAIITGDGRHVVGQNSTDTEFIAVRWSWNTNTERWPNAGTSISSGQVWVVPWPPAMTAALSSALARFFWMAIRSPRPWDRKSASPISRPRVILSSVTRTGPA